MGQKLLTEHNLSYKEWYEEERNNLVKIAGPNIIERINHIGSTYVENLISKPTIDILMEIRSDCDINSLQNILDKDGWVCMSYQEKPHLNISLNKGYTPKGFAEKVFHLHIRYLGDWDELYFRDYLNLHKDVANEYGDLKLTLKEIYEHNRDAYTEAKSEFILKYSNMAREESGNIYKP
ncbi:GrpB family protein [Mobilisporobacter senegalensis]